MNKLELSDSQIKLVPGVYTLHKPGECNHLLDGKPIHREPQKATEGKSVVKIITNDSIREIIIPAKQPRNLPEIWSTNEMNRLKHQSHVIDKKHRLAMIDAANEEKQKLTNECEKRKEMLRNAQSKKRKGKHLNDIEIAEHKRTTYLLKRAEELQRENELEVQEANRLILAAKCQAIRDAQLIEREIIEKELKNEEKRLQEMQEQRNAKECEEEMKKKEQGKTKQKMFVEDILQQVKEREIDQLFATEQKEEEARMLNRVLLQMQREADEELQRKLKTNREKYQESKEINEQLIRYQLIQKEEERIADLRIQEFLRKKAERDAAIAEEQRLAKEAKNREKDRLYELQARALSLQTTGDEMHALRIQEEVERKWRQAERDASRKRVENAEKLKRDRENQIMDLKRMQALDMERDKMEFYKNITVQKQMFEKEVEERRKRKEANMKYRAELLKQINDKENEKIQEKRNMYEDGVALKLQHQLKSEETKSYIKDKVNKLKDLHFVPDKLIQDIERQLKI